MDVKARMASIGPAIGSPARAAILDALLDGRALTATELSRLAGVSPAAGSEHLAKLLSSGLLVRERSGRHRYYRIAGAEVAEALEPLARLGAARPVPVRPLSRKLRAIRRARLCYDHFAGELGVAMTSAMLDRGWLLPANRDFRLTESGERFCAEFGVDPRAARGKRRMFARECLDWSERRPHAAGALAAVLAARAFDRGWVERTGRPRELRVTKRGEAGFERYFGFVLSPG